MGLLASTFLLSPAPLSFTGSFRTTSPRSNDTPFLGVAYYARSWDGWDAAKGIDLFEAVTVQAAKSHQLAAHRGEGSVHLVGLRLERLT
ncbi:hypothetical protein SODALDRAFT_357422 [Sodiomyces alkalinus F11]|uniref:Uncharacterized protein n=1 Tax=Sodiomyces alkalinus (strain CBS 110278 / VKM F-3762 / F11) TaxID=1314773 RepID=A0A3N2Q3N6_SODAK|nr:hypothetical protein SODALDRAFT_357422 [Sodiomyces alkalinus F11]ROT41384.1 hypothetical protein SODALDRAFT_357422 [Sodiomyces alkalinus F11]